MKKQIIILISMLLSICAYGQSQISMFQLIQKPIEVYELDSIGPSTVDSIGEIGFVFGDSIEVLSYCGVTDTLNIYSIHIHVGNQSDGSFNIYSDSIEYNNISTVDTSFIYREGHLIHFNFGVYPYTDTLYAQGWFYRLDGEPSAIVYYPPLLD